MDRQAFWNGLIVTDTHLNRLQDNTESADRNLVLDLIGTGVAYGLELVQLTPTPSLTVTLKAGGAIDGLGRRLYLAADTPVDLSQDSNAVNTAVSSGQERVVDVYLRFKRNEAQDGGTGPLNFLQTESVEILRVMGTAAVAGTAVPPAAPTGNPRLVGRMLRTFGQTAIYTRDFFTSVVQRIQRGADLHATSPQRRLECTPTDPPSMAVRVAGAEVLIDDGYVSVATGNSPTMTAPVTNPRIDLVYVQANGTLAIRAGTENVSPVRPSTRGVLPVAFVGLDPGQVAILEEHIEDARPWLEARTSIQRVHRFVAAGGETVIALPFSYTLGVHALEVLKNGTELDETQYTETSTTSITLGVALTAGQVLVVRSLDASPMGMPTAHAATHLAGGADALTGLALSQIADDLSGLRLGGDDVEWDAVAGKFNIQAVQLLVIGKKRCSSAAQAWGPGTLSATQIYYAYAADNGAGGINYEASTTAPDAARVFKTGDATRRYMFTFVTNASAVPLAVRKVGRRYVHRISGETGNVFKVLNAGAETAMTLVSMDSLETGVGMLVPPHCRIVHLQAQVSTAATPADAAVKTPGTGGSINLCGASIASTTRRVDLAIETNSTQQIEYQVGHASATLTLFCTGWEE